MGSHDDATGVVALPGAGAPVRFGGLVLALALAALPRAAVADSPAAPIASAQPEDAPFKLSLPTEADHALWRRPGLRLMLGVAYGQLRGLGNVPSGRLLGAIVRVGTRLDEAWSLLASFQYASASERGGLSGLRFAGTLDPTWHVSEHVELALGLGFGGIVEGRTGRADPDPTQRSALNHSYTFPDSSPALPSCSGVGVTGLLRASWMTALGPVSATGLSAEVIGQWTGCVDTLGRVEPDTARPITRRQFWPHVGGTLAWIIAWR